MSIRNSLLPCPFCGEQPTRGYFRDFEASTTYNKVYRYQIRCENKNCIRPTTPAYCNEDSVISIWNSRAIIKQLDKEVK